MGDNSAHTYKGLSNVFPHIVTNLSGDKNGKKKKVLPAKTLP
jgi:hypothetical protein